MEEENFLRIFVNIFEKASSSSDFFLLLDDVICTICEVFDIDSIEAAFNEENRLTYIGYDRNQSAARSEKRITNILISNQNEFFTKNTDRIMRDSLCVKNNYTIIQTCSLESLNYKYGLLFFGRKSGEKLSEKEISQIKKISEILSVYGSVYEYRKGQKFQNRTINLFSEVGNEIIMLKPIDNLLRDICLMVQQQMEYDHVHVLLTDNDRQNLIFKESCGCSMEERLIATNGKIRINDDSIVGWVATHGKTYVTNDVSADPLYLEVEPGILSECAIPLILKGRVIGVLDIASEEKNEFSSSDIATFELLGLQIAIAIRNATLFDEIKAKFHISMAMHDINMSIIGDYTEDEIIDVILDQASKVTESDNIEFAFWKIEENYLRQMKTVCRGNEKIFKEDKVRNLQKKCAFSKKPIFRNNYSLSQTDTVNIICIPLLWGDPVMASLTIIRNTERTKFDRNELWSLSILSDIGAATLHNSDMHYQLKQLTMQLEEKVDVARKEIAEQNKEIQQILLKTVRIQEDERSRIARDLHDSALQLLASTGYELKAVEISLEQGNYEESLKLAMDVKDTIKQAQDEIRHIIYDLHPPVMTSTDLVTAIHMKCNKLFKYSDIQFHLKFSGDVPEISASDEVTIYRIIEEALHNIIKHSNASDAFIKIYFHPEKIIMSIADNGHGFDVNTIQYNDENGHFGLIGMRERTLMMGGSMNVHSSPGRGSSIVFTIPLGKIDYDRKNEKSRLL